MWRLDERNHIVGDFIDTKIDLTQLSELNRAYVVRALNGYEKMVRFVRGIQSDAHHLMEELGVDEATD